jgi:hypothetical protein
MGHSSIQVTVDTYGHLVPSANISFVDQLDVIPDANCEPGVQKSATSAQSSPERETEIPSEVVDSIGGGG